jgi:hypothetical protein
MWMVCYHHFRFFPIKISLLKESLAKCFIKLILGVKIHFFTKTKFQSIKLNDF